MPLALSVSFVSVVLPHVLLVPLPVRPETQRDVIQEAVLVLLAELHGLLDALPEKCLGLLAVQTRQDLVCEVDNAAEDVVKEYKEGPANCPAHGVHAGPIPQLRVLQNPQHLFVVLLWGFPLVGLGHCIDIHLWRHVGAILLGGRPIPPTLGACYEKVCVMGAHHHLLELTADLGAHANSGPQLLLPCQPLFLFLLPVLPFLVGTHRRVVGQQLRLQPAEEELLLGLHSVNDVLHLVGLHQLVPHSTPACSFTVGYAQQFGIDLPLGMQRQLQTLHFGPADIQQLPEPPIRGFKGLHPKWTRGGALRPGRPLGAVSPLLGLGLQHGPHWVLGAEERWTPALVRTGKTGLPGGRRLCGACAGGHLAAAIQACPRCRFHVGGEDLADALEV
mmetsp:Transcript_41165/g.73801  ORF Transcript_41165/g.73801 Transcript_41165/m.73801 type:complete len:389 (-) Transcript_41165:221-1387(-)